MAHLTNFLWTFSCDYHRRILPSLSIPCCKKSGMTKNNKKKLNQGGRPQGYARRIVLRLKRHEESKRKSLEQWCRFKITSDNACRVVLWSKVEQIDLLCAWSNTNYRPFSAGVTFGNQRSILSFWLLHIDHFKFLVWNLPSVKVP